MTCRFHAQLSIPLSLPPSSFLPVFRFSLLLPYLFIPISPSPLLL